MHPDPKRHKYYDPAATLSDDQIPNRHRRADILPLQTSPSKIRRWARSPATEKQRELLKLNFLDQKSLYEAMCRITFKFNQRAIQDLVLEHAKHREAA